MIRGWWGLLLYAPRTPTEPYQRPYILTVTSSFLFCRGRWRRVLVFVHRYQIWPFFACLVVPCGRKSLQFKSTHWAQPQALRKPVDQCVIKLRNIYHEHTSFDFFCRFQLYRQSHQYCAFLNRTDRNNCVCSVCELLWRSLWYCKFLHTHPISIHPLLATGLTVRVIITEGDFVLQRYSWH